MKKLSSLKKNAILCLAIILLGSSCATTKSAHKSPDVKSHVQDQPWENLVDNCRQTNDLEWYECKREALDRAYNDLVNMAYDIDELLIENDYIKQKYEIEKAISEAELNVWYRKWYITVPLGIVAGAAMGIAIGVGVK